MLPALNRSIAQSASPTDRETATVPQGPTRRDLASGRLVQPFDIEVYVGRCWLTRSLGPDPAPAFAALPEWLLRTLPPAMLPHCAPSTKPGEEEAVYETAVPRSR
jgi:anti-sigma factor RsiW